MNRLSGIISKVTSNQDMSAVEIDVAGHVFSALLLETPVSLAHLRKGETVFVLCKETEVAVAKGPTEHLSIRNRIPCRLQSLEKGLILARLDLRFGEMKLVSVISSESVERLGLKVGDALEALIKATEISISESRAYEL